MPLHQAVLQSNFQAVRLLVEAGADVDAQNCNRLTPLQCCKAPGDIAGKISVISNSNQNRKVLKSLRDLECKLCDTRVHFGLMDKLSD